MSSTVKTQSDQQMTGDVSAYGRRVLEEYEERSKLQSLLSRQILAASGATVTTISGWFTNRLWKQRQYSRVGIAGILAVCSLTAGSIAVLCWEYLVTRPIDKERLLCSVCVATRGSAVAVLGGVIIPGMFGALGTRLKPFPKSLPQLLGASAHLPKPLGTAGIILMSVQAGVGYLLAGKQIELKLEERVIRRKIFTEHQEITR
ncbi:uncharacterized protein LOC134196483 [Corticium candelabrum]|uniref:uncharacterized protein LOC134196483 n=1 Tax=Corticium candelabrum TaxID=121492 RepID=UPI002E271D0C|nr:uncharacterized protein LOC134196483 [Corticium candelabrum]